MATIREVAAKAGVSIATVSYVLNDSRRVRPQTEQRVLWAAKELGYAPNVAARSLVSGRSSIVGLVVPDIGNPFFPEITKAFQEAAGMAGLEAMVMNTNYDEQRTRHSVERLVSLQVPGAAFLTSQVGRDVRESLAARGISAVYLDHGVAGDHISCIALDYAHGIQSAAAHLLELGHRRIGFIGGPAQGSSAQLRKQAFLEAASRAGTVDAKAIDSDFSVQGGYFSCAKLLKVFPATALVAANDLMAIGALHCAYDRQISVPAQLSIIGFDDITFAQFTQPALTTVAVPRTEVGRLAFEALHALITNPGRGVEYEVKTSLIVRQTTARPAPDDKVEA
ncbi:MAG TPA: LacI family DNA-binding transcriptional regulator [Bryobacteraceae bacterium]|nr:LacI family DNA-binding transcriptional regulator [Bryobacteraceae bacterium]